MRRSVDQSKLSCSKCASEKDEDTKVNVLIYQKR